MKIINIGILAHVDAWKDDLDGEPAICQRSHFRTGERRKRDNEDGHHGFWSGRRGITIQAAVTSFQWHRCKVNIVDTPGHMDFFGGGVPLFGCF